MMGTFPLRHFLQSLCCNSCWNYAVFWKLEHDNKMILTWEDGCYDHPKLIGSAKSIPDDICFTWSNEISSSCGGSNGNNVHSSEYPIAQAVAVMKNVQYPWGEGVVGEVAYTGIHYWVLYDNISAGEFSYKVIPECPGEWLLQFAAGIKTILLVPVVPHGVLQLGSLEKVAEYFALVAYIRDKFNAYQNDMNISPSVSKEVRAQIPSSLMPFVKDNMDGSSTTNVNQMKYDDPKAVYSVKTLNHKLSNTNEVMPGCLVQDGCHIPRRDVLDILNSKKENDISIKSMGLIEVSKPLNDSMMIDGSMVGSSVAEKLQAFSISDKCNMAIFGEHANVTIDSYLDEGMMEQPFMDEDADNRVCENLSTFLSFPLDCQLYKAFGPSSLGQIQKYLGDSSLSGQDAYSSSSQIFSRALAHGTKPSNLKSSRWFTKMDEADHLLAHVVPRMRGSLNDNSSSKLKNLKSSVPLSGLFAASNNAHSQSEERTYMGEKSVKWSFVTSAFDARDQNASTESPPSSAFELVMSTLTEQQHNNVCGYERSKPSNARKRRARPGKNQRPRPRDRQLIQDSVKKLRKLVPNGSKCSIDSLLDRTIKHMLFLRSVTDQADKLGQRVHQELNGQKNMKSVGNKYDNQSGKTWAVELGGDRLVCPIVVEDLEECPGHMLIEMLCNDHELFLEITEVIHHLELLILKGVMESHSNNTWALFIVQAPRGFQRLDIFLPLMQLLKHKLCPISSKI